MRTNISMLGWSVISRSCENVRHVLAVQDSAAMIVDQLAYQQASDYASLYTSIANSYRALGTNAGNSLLGSLYMQWHPHKIQRIPL